MDSVRNSSFVDISGLTDQEQFEDDTKREAMQMILDNQDNFEPEVVDKALEDLNSQMHKPLVSEQDLEDAENNAVAEETDDSVPIFDGTNQPIDPNAFITNI